VEQARLPAAAKPRTRRGLRATLPLAALSGSRLLEDVDDAREFEDHQHDEHDADHGERVATGRRTLEARSKRRDFGVGQRGNPGIHFGRIDAEPDHLVADIGPREHVDIQAAAQKWVDSSISKTANVPTDFPYEKFKDIYLYAHEQGLKGCTTFRFNPEAFQGVLVKEEDLKNTTYVFTLEDGTEVEVKGDQEIEYDGEVHTAANLFDALKEGYYGKF